MRQSPRFLMFLFSFLGIPTVIWACLWDYDTLMMERQRFPSALELITGKFLRHTPEFYQWRINDRLAKLKADPDNVAYYDDLAVAYNKIGEHQKAIETILIKEKKNPGLYETYANLGTFLFYTGDYEKSLEYIEKALAINPDAHFGRERYQKYLTEYVLSVRKEGKLELPLARLKRSDGTSIDLADYIRMKQNENLNSIERLPAALKGVQGMMRFANHESPVLLEALAGLLMHGRDPQTDAKRLAARAYLKASYVVPDEAAKRAYRDRTEGAILYQTINPAADTPLRLQTLEADFQRELRDAEAWYAELRTKELKWVREGKDPEVEFTRLYYTEPSVISQEENYTPREKIASFIANITGEQPAFVNATLIPRAIFALVILLSIGGATVWWRRRRRKRRPSAA